ncbi:hypothetical protein HAX54_049819, partial [Datura stramonium]|nr:hypothetical protein [Datura stramonium]
DPSHSPVDPRNRLEARREFPIPHTIVPQVPVGITVGRDSAPPVVSDSVELRKCCVIDPSAPIVPL